MQNRRLLISIFVGLLLSSIYLIILVNAATTKKFNPVSDSFVTSTESNMYSNFGGQGRLAVSYSTNMFVGSQVSYLMFNLNSIPSDCIIESAFLYLHTSFVTETHRIGVYYCPSNDWKEYEINWVNMPEVIGEAIDSIFVPKDYELYTWDVTSVVSSLSRSDPLLTLVLMSEDPIGSGWVWFHSRDQEYSWIEENKPMLEVVYDTPPSPPQDTSTNIEPYTPAKTDIDYNRDSDFIGIVIVVIFGLFGLFGFLFIRSIRNESKNSNGKNES